MFVGPENQTGFDLGNDTLSRLSDPVQMMTGIATAPPSVTPPCGSLLTIRANRIAPCAKKFPSCAKKFSSNPGLGFCVPALKRVGFVLRLATFCVVFSAGHAEGTQNSMLDPKIQTTLFRADLGSQNQISSQEQGPQQFGNSLSTDKGALFSENNLSHNQQTKERLFVLEKGQDRPSTNQPQTSSTLNNQALIMEEFHDASTTFPNDPDGDYEMNESAVGMLDFDLSNTGEHSHGMDNP